MRAREERENCVCTKPKDRRIIKCKSEGGGRKILSVLNIVTGKRRRGVGKIEREGERESAGQEREHRRQGKV